MRDDKTLYLLDGTYYIFRAFHGMRELRTSKGMPTNDMPPPTKNAPTLPERRTA